MSTNVHAVDSLREKMAKVMGWNISSDIKCETELFKFPTAGQKLQSTGEGNINGYLMAGQIWHPDNDLNQAFMLVEKMREKGYRLSLNEDWDGKGGWLASFIPHWNTKVKPGEAINDDPALAICLAIEKAMEEK